MRRMKNTKTGETINVMEHVILRNFWEYYITDEVDGDVAKCLVLGFEDELGDVYLPEIAPYVIAKTKKLREVMPAPNWQWI